MFLKHQLPGLRTGRRVCPIHGSLRQLRLKFFLSMILGISTVGLSIEVQADSIRDPEEECLILGFTRDMFSSVHIPDALAAMQIWATELKQQQGFIGHVETIIFEDADEVLQSLRRNAVDLVIIGTDDYLSIQSEAMMEPYFLAQRAGNVADQIILLVHSKSGVQSLDDLEKKRIIYLNNPRSALGITWIKTLLLEKGYSDLADFFKQVEATEKASKAILSVFFQQADACFVHESAFLMMTELNPQIRKELVAIDYSPYLIPSVTCIRKNYHPEYKEAVIAALSTLHQNPRGQQILLLFGEEKLVPYKDTYLESTKRLIAKHMKLKRSFEVREGRSSRLTENDGPRP